MARSSRILVTGATGNLGTKAVAALRAAGHDDLVEFDLVAKRDDAVTTADLRTFDASWADRFEGVDVVLHLAADHRAVADWDSVAANNIDVSLNVFRAAEAAGVRRIVFAASNWIVGGHRFTNDRLTPLTPPRPINPYGAAKLFIERAGLDLADRAGLTFVSLRIGYCQPGGNVPGPNMAFGRWGQEMWLSNNDWGQAAVLACTAPCSGGIVCNVMSRNEGMRWSLDETESAIGYVPASTHRPEMTLTGRIRDAVARVRDRMVPRSSGTPLFGDRW